MGWGGGIQRGSSANYRSSAAASPAVLLSWPTHHFTFIFLLLCALVRCYSRAQWFACLCTLVATATRNHVGEMLDTVHREHPFHPSRHRPPQATPSSLGKGGEEESISPHPNGRGNGESCTAALRPPHP